MISQLKTSESYIQFYKSRYSTIVSALLYLLVFCVSLDRLGRRPRKNGCNAILRGILQISYRLNFAEEGSTFGEIRDITSKFLNLGKASKIDQNRCRGSQRSRVLLSMDASESSGLKLRRRKKSRNISVTGKLNSRAQECKTYAPSSCFIHLCIACTLSLMNVFFRPRSYESLTHQIFEDRGPGMRCRFY